MPLLDVQPLVFLTGISAAGKSTVADLLARRFARGVHVKGDVFRRMIVAGRREMSSTPSPDAWSQLRLRYQLGAAVADAYHRAGFAVVVQDVVIGAVLAEYVAMLAARPLVVIVLTPDPEVVARREANRPKVAYREGFDGVTALDRALREETPRIGLWLDNSDHRPDETVNEIIQRGLSEGQIE